MNKIHCDGNDALSMIPGTLKDNSDLTLWTLKLHYTFRESKMKAQGEHNRIEEMTMDTVIQQLMIEEERQKLRDDINLLERERPINYIKRKAQFLNFKIKCTTYLRKKNKLYKTESDEGSTCNHILF